MQFAWDGAELRAGNETPSRFSQFTSWLVEGLEKGEAAPGDEQITMDALYRYLFRRARSAGATSTPQRFVQGGVGDLVISHNPFAGWSQVDPQTTATLIASLSAEEFRMRLGAVAELAQQLAEGNSVAARSARQLLQRRLERERDYLVRTAITKALQENWPAEAAQEAQEERRAEAVPLATRQEQLAAAARQAEEEQRWAAAARQAEEEKRRAAAARPRLGDASTGPSWLVAPRTVWNIARQTQRDLVAKTGKRLIICIAAAEVCAVLIAGNLFYSGIHPNGLKAVRELNNLEVAPSSSTGAPEVKPPPQAEPTALPQAAPTASPQTAPTAPPQAEPTASPQATPTASPQAAPTAPPQAAPTAPPQAAPTALPQTVPTALPQTVPTALPQTALTASPQAALTASPQAAPTAPPQAAPTALPQTVPTALPQTAPTAPPQAAPTALSETERLNLEELHRIQHSQPKHRYRHRQ